MNELTAWLSSNFIFNIETLLHYWTGFVTTVQLVFLSLVLGLCIALPLAVARVYGPTWLKWIIAAYVYVFRGTPLLIQLYIIYYGVSTIDGIQDSIWWVVVKEAFYPALIAFMLNTAAYTTEIIRGAVVETPHGEIEAAKAYGMNQWTMLKRIILPSAIRRALPAYSNEVIFMLHASAIASVVTLVDLTGAARDIYAKYYAPFEAFLFVAAIYLCLTFSIVYGFRRLENRLLAHLKAR